LQFEDAISFNRQPIRNHTATSCALPLMNTVPLGANTKAYTLDPPSSVSPPERIFNVSRDGLLEEPTGQLAEKIIDQVNNHWSEDS